jgi:3-deoxy-manno-octulosonate cytidylyltransferase (CMP-KDO synthetase)
MNFIVVIPARFASSRLPGKPLIDIAGKSLIQRTWERTIEAVNPESVYVATDNEKIVSHCEFFGIQTILTSDKCLTGTDRVAEVAKKIIVDFYINVQGDEPLINPDDILATITACRKYPGEVINGFASIKAEDDYRSLTIPKVIARPDGRLLYMSRSPIPGNKSNTFEKAWKQVCVYGFPRKSLFDYTGTNGKTDLEAIEDLEMLRFLELGYDVRMIPLSHDSIAVDTPADIERVLQYLKKNNLS